jgi:queuine tRNA-ribosyltransferase accessory subunit
MSTNHGGSTTPDVDGSIVETVKATSNTTRSLSELARNITSFKWSRPLPEFMATSSRGSIPHLTPDKIYQHSNIPSVHIGLEDFITSPVQGSPILSIETTLQRYLAYPESMSLVLSARRANPVPINASWDDRIEIITIDGHKPFPVETFINAVHQLHLRENDIVISIPDITETPGVKRLTKMVQRTQRWLNLLLESNVSPLITCI